MKYQILALVVTAMLGVSGPAPAADFTAGDITVGDPWSRATVGAAKNGAVYLKIANGGDTADRLVAASSTVAGVVSLHRSAMEEGVMKMRPVESVGIGPGETAVLKPGGLHIMLMNLKRPLKEGEMFAVELSFESAGTIPIQVMVAKPGALHGGMMKHD
jgi:copper(I)-binding protein